MYRIRLLHWITERSIRGSSAKQSTKRFSEIYHAASSHELGSFLKAKFPRRRHAKSSLQSYCYPSAGYFKTFPVLGIGYVFYSRHRNSILCWSYFENFRL